MNYSLKLLKLSNKQTIELSNIAVQEASISFGFLIIFIVILSVCNIFPQTIYAESFSQSDTTKSVRTELITISDNKITEPIGKYSAYNIITREELSRAGIIQASELFSKIPGMHINNYGGLGGMKTISTRGSNASHTLVMLDGMPISSSQNSSFDLSVYPISLIDNIQIIRGGQSSRYGSQAISGTVNFTTNVPTDRIARFTVRYASFNEMLLALNYHFKIHNSMLSLNLERTSSDGSYPFDFVQFGEKLSVKRENAQFTNTVGSIAQQYSQSNFSMKNNIILRQTSRGIPGAVLQGRIENKVAKLDEDEVIFLNSLNYIINKSSFLKNNIMFKFNQMNYIDDLFKTYPNSLTNNLYISRDFAMNSSYSNITEHYNYEISSHISYSDLRGNMLDPNVDGSASRINPAIAGNIEKQFDWENYALSAFAAGRLDLTNNHKPAYSPSFGVVFEQKITQLNYKFFVSRNFRLPNFNEMYYLNYGTSNLKPETSLNYNLSISYNFIQSERNNISINLGGFYIETKDKIIAIPKTPISWSAANIDKTNNFGIELSVIGKLNSLNIDNIGINYTLQFPKNITDKSDLQNKLLPYQPQELISSFFTIDLKYLQFHTSIEYSSFRYIQPDNSVREVLPSYLIANVGLSKQIEIGKHIVFIRSDINNITNKQFAIIKNYPMPGRQYRLSLNYDILRR